MSFKDLLHETFSALAANKGRTALTILGIVIGIAAVIAMTSLIGGLKQGLISELGLEQSRMVNIMYSGAEGQTSSLEDLRMIQQNVEGYEFVTGSQYGSAKAATGTKSKDVSVMGVGPGFFHAMSMKATAGRLLSDGELAGDSMCVVLDSVSKRELFGEDEDCVGKTIKLNDVDYEVVGVTESSNIMAGVGSIYMPFNTCAIRVSGTYEVQSITAFVQEDADIDDVVERTKEYLRKTYRIDDETGYLYVESMKSIQEELDSMMMAFQMLMTAVASISLLVGGIGIMNMMLTNVTERIREIGLRKALGARNRDITRQFLLESVAVCLVGGIIGFALGFLIAWGLAAIGAFSLSALGTQGMAIKPVVAADTVIMSIGICVVIGIVFGIGPARRAAKLDPVESLRFQ